MTANRVNALVGDRRVCCPCVDGVELLTIFPSSAHLHGASTVGSQEGDNIHPAQPTCKHARFVSRRESQSHIAVAAKVDTRCTIPVRGG